jgi:hypothetical protein
MPGAGGGRDLPSPRVFLTEHKNLRKNINIIKTYLFFHSEYSRAVAHQTWLEGP